MRSTFLLLSHKDFKLGGAALKKIASSGGRRENFWGISCEKSRFYAKNYIFSNFRGGARPPLDPPQGTDMVFKMYLLLRFTVPE